MIDATYRIIRYIPDPARNEPVNVGVVVWCQGRHAIEFDSAAFGRVLAGNPDLDRKAYEGFAEFLREELARSWPEDDQDVAAYLGEQIRFPMMTTRDLVTRINEADRQSFSLDDELVRSATWLNGRLVKLRFRSTPERNSSPIRMMRSRLSPLIKSRQVEEHVSVTGTTTGLDREVAFFANSGANIALEVVNLPPNAKEMGIARICDATANRTKDILSSPKVKDVVLWVPLDIHQEAIVHAPLVYTILEMAGPSCHIQGSLEAATEDFLQLAGKDKSIIR